MSFFGYRPRAALVARLNRRVYTPAQQIEFHLMHNDAPAPPTPQGTLEDKLSFLDAISVKAKSMIEGRVNVMNSDLICAQLAANAIKGLEDIHLHRADIGPHVMELRETFRDIESTAYDVFRGINRGRWLLVASLAFKFTGIVIIGAFIPTSLDLIINLPRPDSLAKLLDTLFKAAPFLTPLVWAAITAATKKDRILSREFRTTAAWIRKAAAVVYRILDEDILPAIPPIVPVPGPLPHPPQVPIAAPDAIASPSYHTAPSTPAAPARDAGAIPSTHTPSG